MTLSITNTRSSPPKKNSKDKQKISFGAFSIASKLSKIEQNPILSLATLDLFGMIAPRTITELNRNKKEIGHLNWHSGRERLFDELSSSIALYFMPGVVLSKIGTKLLENKHNPLKLNTKAFIDYDNLNVFKENIDKVLQEQKQGKSINKLREEVARKILKNTRDYSNNSNKLSDKLINEIVEIVGGLKDKANLDQVEKLIKSQDQKAKTLTKQGLLIDKETTFMKQCNSKNIFQKIAKELGENDLSILGETKNTMAKSSPNNLIRDIFTATDDILTKAASLIKTQGGNLDIESTMSLEDIKSLPNKADDIVKSMKKIKIGKTLIPIISTVTVLMTLPKINVLITKKLTGKNEFPGVCGLTKPHSKYKPPDNNSFTNYNNNLIPSYKQNVFKDFEDSLFTKE